MRCMYVNKRAVLVLQPLRIEARDGASPIHKTKTTECSYNE